MQACNGKLEWLLVMQLNRPNIHNMLQSLLSCYLLLCDVCLRRILLSFPLLVCFFSLVYVLGDALKQVSLPFLRIKEYMRCLAAIAASLMAFQSGGLVRSYRASGVCFSGIFLLHLFIHMNLGQKAQRTKPAVLFHTAHWSFPAAQLTL